MDTFADRVILLQSESARIKQYLHILPPNAWTRPSACERWDVRDVVGHLTSVAELYANGISRGLQEDVSPQAGLPPAGASTGASLNEFIAQSALACQERLGDQVLSVYDAADDQLNRLLAGLSPQDWVKPCYHPGRLKELAVHEWDIRSRLEPNAPLSPASLPAIITTISDSIASGSILWAFWPGPRLSAPVRYRFAVTGPVPYQTTLVVAGDRVDIEEAGDASVHVTFHCDTETFVLLIYGRLTLKAALDKGRVVVEGDRSVATACSQWFKGI